MPQANITYDVPYNRKLVDFLKELDEKHWRKLGTAYAPTMFQEKLGNFHGVKNWRWKPSQSNVCPIW